MTVCPFERLSFRDQERIEHYGREAGREYVSTFPEQRPDIAWLRSAYERDAAGHAWPADSYYWYELAAREEIRFQRTRR